MRNKAKRPTIDWHMLATYNLSDYFNLSLDYMYDNIVTGDDCDDGDTDDGDGDSDDVDDGDDDDDGDGDEYDGSGRCQEVVSGACGLMQLCWRTTDGSHPHPVRINLRQVRMPLPLAVFVYFRYEWVFLFFVV